MHIDLKGNHTLKHCLAICIWIALGLVAHAESGGEANCPDNGIENARTHDEVWLLSCRSLDCPKQGSPVHAEELTEGLPAWQFNLTDNKWDRSEIVNFWKASPTLQTVVWVHGNLTTSSEAFSTGLTVYRQLIRTAENQGPIRFIIWSWPASKTLTRRVPDARIKAARTTWAGLRLAGVLQQISGENTVGLIGFSFGAQVISAALEVLAGGELNQTTLKPQPAQVSYRVTLFAAALDSYWLLPERRFGQAFNVIDSLTLINNYCDWVLKHYGKLYCHCARRGPSALGYTGLAVGSLSAEEQKHIQQFNASGSVGKQHAWRAYIESKTMMELIRKGTFGEGQNNPRLSQQVSTGSQ